MLVEQLREWATLIEDGKTPIEAVVAGMREVADDLDDDALPSPSKEQIAYQLGKLAGERMERDKFRCIADRVIVRVKDRLAALHADADDVSMPRMTRSEVDLVTTCYGGEAPPENVKFDEVKFMGSMVEVLDEP